MKEFASLGMAAMEKAKGKFFIYHCKLRGEMLHQKHESYGQLLSL